MLVQALIEIGDIDLLSNSEYSELRIVNSRNCSIFVEYDAPLGGWNKDVLIKYDLLAYNIYACFDLYLGEIWIGCDDIASRFNFTSRL